MTVQILKGDCRDVLCTLPDESVHCVVTSPPYWGLRDYGTATWDGGDSQCDHKKHHDMSTSNLQGGKTTTLNNHYYPSNCGKCDAIRTDSQLGLERTLGEHVETMVGVFREVRRVLRKDGTLWLNYGDSYATSANGRSAADTKAAGNDDRTFRDKPFSTIGPVYNPNSANGGFRGKNAGRTETDADLVPKGRIEAGGYLKPKDLCGIPWRVAFALQADGWWLRQDIIWSKPNPMPESVTDRCTKSHEYLFLLTKSERYYYDAEAIKEQATYPEGPGNVKPVKGVGIAGFETRGGFGKGPMPSETRNRRSVWEIATAPFSEAHFATFPPALIEPCIKAGTSEKGCCAKCGAPWVRQLGKPSYGNSRGTIGGEKGCDPSNGWSGYPSVSKIVETLGWSPSCSCDAAVIPATVLDCFGGAGTTGLVADRLGRNAILIELNPQYAEMAERRITNDAGLFANVAAE